MRMYLDPDPNINQDWEILNKHICDTEFQIQCPPLNRITLGQHKSDNNNRKIQLSYVFCLLLRQGFSNFFGWWHLQLLIKIWRPKRHLATLFNVKYLLKWLNFGPHDQKNHNFNIWRPFLEVSRPSKGSRPLVWEPLC